VHALKHFRLRVIQQLWNGILIQNVLAQVLTLIKNGNALAGKTHLRKEPLAAIKLLPLVSKVLTLKTT
jgi:hypothetical protein